MKKKKEKEIPSFIDCIFDFSTTWQRLQFGNDLTFKPVITGANERGLVINSRTLMNRIRDIYIYIASGRWAKRRQRGGGYSVRWPGGRHVAELA